MKQNYRQQVASHQRSMEAEVREIFVRTVNESETIDPPCTLEEMRERLQVVRKIWKDRMGGKTTNEGRKEMRGDG